MCNYSDPFGLCPWCIGAGAGALLGAGGTVLYNYLHDQPLSTNVVRNTLVGAGVGATLGVGWQAVAARAATSTAVAASAGAAGTGGSLTGRIVDALENAGPEMGARVNAALGQIPSNLKALMTTNAETGAVTIRGGAGSRAREIILNTDGSSVVRAFDAAKNVWNTVKEIKPPQ